MPSGKWHWNQYAPKTSFARNDSKDFLVRVDARTAALIGDRTRFRPLKHSGDRFRYIFHIGWLQPRQPAAEHWVDWKPAKELEDDAKKCVIGSEHHRRTNEGGVGKRGTGRQFAFTPLTDIE